ncbi:hypothetical protein GF327_07470 [Candidatus Woesearchaeota archaeon]|nr:hypothetical protein [Candidatus Woesearchaeota archaeon]
MVIALYSDFFKGWSVVDKLEKLMNTVGTLMSSDKGYGESTKKNLDMMGYELLKYLRSEMIDYYKQTISLACF